MRTQHSLLIFFLNLTCSLASAEVLEPTQKAVRVEYSRGNATELYAGENKVSVKNATGFEKRDITNTSILGSFGLGYRSQIDLGLAYSDVDVGTQGQGGISEVSARYLYQVYSSSAFNFDIGAGFRAPGDNRTGDSFLALSDGLTKYDFFLGASYNISLVKLGLNSRYTDRSHAVAGSQALNEFALIVIPTNSIQIGGFYQIFSTSKGRNISDADFGGKFSEVKEEYHALGLSLAYRIDQTFIVDARYGKKLSNNIRNTDANSTLGLGLTAVF